MRFESQAALGIAAVMLGGSLLRDRRQRAGLSLALLGGLLVLMLRLSLHLKVPMGDYDNFVEDRDHFERYFGDAVGFQYHLGGTIVHLFDGWFGSTEHSPVRAFDALARVAAVLFVLGLALFAVRERWSARVLRYAALAIAVPTTLLFFGYHEFGHLPAALDVVAVPLALVGLEQRRRPLVIAAGALAGVGSALHGFGLIGLGFIVALVGAYLWKDEAARSALGLSLPVGVAAAGLLGWLIWLPMYLIGAGWSIDPGHSEFSPLRPLLHSHIAEHRIVQPILSTSAITEIGWELAVTGAALVLIAAWFVRGPARQALLIGTVPVLVFVIWFWPVQGIGNDSDFLGSAFPAAYAAAWLIAGNLRASIIGFLILVAGNAAMAHILTWGFVHSPIPQ
ncbi:MAG TPA: hypothetical protein VIM05_00335 [Gaiellaceae bacterium]